MTKLEATPADRELFIDICGAPDDDPKAHEEVRAGLWDRNVTMQKLIRHRIEHTRTTAPSRDALVEALGEALFLLSDHLRRLKVLASDDAAHDAYEQVVARFAALKGDAQ